MLVDCRQAESTFALLPDVFKNPYFHPRFIKADALRNRDLQPKFFVYQEGEALYYYAFHLGLVPGTEFRDIQAPYPYGGPLSSSSDTGFLTRAGQEFEHWCREEKVLAEFVRFHPLVENWRFFAGDVQELRDTVWMDLAQEQPFESFSSRVRNAIRKAEKSPLDLEWQSAAAGRHFLSLYTQAMDQLQADRFYYFPRNYFEELGRWGQFRLLFCWKGAELIAASLFLYNARMMEYHLAASTPEGRRLNASTLILARAAEDGRRLRCRWMHLGGGTDDRADNSLLFFKSGFSKRRARFKIGWRIHRQADYERMLAEWKARGQTGERILFYRK